MSSNEGSRAGQWGVRDLPGGDASRKLASSPGIIMSFAQMPLLLGKLLQQRAHLRGIFTTPRAGKIEYLLLLRLIVRN